MTRFDLVQPQLNQDNTYSLGPVEYQVEESGDTWGAEHQVAVVGRPFSSTFCQGIRTKLNLVRVW